MKPKLKITGFLTLCVKETRKDGTSITRKFHQKNLIVNTGLDSIKRGLALGSLTSGFLASFKVGIGTTPPVVSNVDLESPVEITSGVITKALSSIDSSGIGILIANFELTFDEAVGNTLTECGLFFQSNELFSRVILSSPIPKTNSNFVTGTWTITIQNA